MNCFLKRFRLWLVAFAGIGGALALADTGRNGAWGDRGDGTFRNPVIAADYSDPDVIRVGEDFYLVTSTFQMSPGVTVLHSKDLVNWETIGAAIPDVSKLGADLNWNKMNRYNEGVYAPSLRFHDGKFWVFVNVHSGEVFFSVPRRIPPGRGRSRKLRIETASCCGRMAGPIRARFGTTTARRISLRVIRADAGSAICLK
jgi:hypothetical protein